MWFAKWPPVFSRPVRISLRLSIGATFRQYLHSTQWIAFLSIVPQNCPDYCIIKSLCLSTLFVFGTSHIAYGRIWKDAGDGGGGTVNPPPAITFPENAPGYLEFSFDGPRLGRACTRIIEPAEPTDHAWSDNFICAPVDIGIRFSYASPIAGMKCTSLNEPADPHTWADNYICLPPSSPIDFQWNTAGPIPEKRCLQIKEPSDPHSWNDNYLCYVLDIKFKASNPAIPSDIVADIEGSADLPKVNWAKVAKETLSGGAAGGTFGGLIGGAPGRVFFLIIGSGLGAIAEIKAQGQAMSSGSSNTTVDKEVGKEVRIHEGGAKVTGGGDGFTVNGK
jgi:hypothetical protein